MDKKYITFYDKFIRHSKTVSDGGVVWNRELLIFIFKDSMARLIS